MTTPEKTGSTPPVSPEVALPRVDRRMFRLAVACACALAVFFIYDWHGGDIIHLYQGLFIYFLAVLPALLWSKRSDGGFPLLEVLLLTTVNTYALPLLSGHEALNNYDDAVITAAANVVIVYQLSAIAAYLAVRGHPKLTPFWTEEIIAEGFGKFLTYGLAITTIYSFASTFLHDAIFDRLPADSEGLLRAVFFGLGIICTFVLCRRWGLGLLKPGARVFVVANLALQFFIESSSLLLITGISTVVLALLGYVSGSRKVPVVALAIVGTILAILHNGKSTMRVRHWGPDAPAVTVTDLPSLYREWFTVGLVPDESSELNPAAKLLDRTSLLQLVCLVVDRTPSKQPFLDGDTYLTIPAQFIPRLFWPDKPVALESTYRLSVYYGLQTEEETKSTTIGFGMVSEAYANFGFYGVALLGGLFGFAFKKVTIWTRFSPMLSYGGLVLVLLMAWSFQTEDTLSVWISSLFQGCIAVLGAPMILRNLIN